MPKLSKTKALAAAAAEVGVVHYADGGYGYSTYSHKHNTWWAPYCTQPYHGALASRADAIARAAASLMLGCAEIDLNEPSHPQGNARERLAQYLACNAQAGGQ